LDYSQIKAGKFRTKISRFNVREAIEKVMSIQRQKAEDTGIELSVRYLNIGETDEKTENKYSPFLHSDD